MKQETKELLIEYDKQFGDMFPLMELRGVSEYMIQEMIKECIKQNKLYEDVYKPDDNLMY